ncbi:MAG: hypothetical protein IJD06_06400 [Clostridia bacterium]|nr:hypothetical protein [Clostridia bacterium]
MKNVKILSVLFALVMLFTLVSVSVFAAEEPVAEAAAETVADEVEENASEGGLKVQPMNFIYNLKYMGVGMFCIIVVIGVLIGVTMALNKITAPKKK